MTSLMYAAESGQKDVVKILLEHGAAINAKSKYGQLLQIVITVQYFNPFNMKYFLSIYLFVFILLGHTSLALAIQGSHTEIVKLLLQHGADTKAKDCLG